LGFALRRFLRNVFGRFAAKILKLLWRDLSVFDEPKDKILG
jgi:hypothetical protein